jgi:NB-ARC domain
LIQLTSGNTDVILSPSPPYVDISQNTAPSYIERKILSKLLEDKLQTFHEERNPPYSLAISGLGGAGKSQLVIRYVHEHRDIYSHVFWINTESQSSILDSYQRIFDNLQLPILKMEIPSMEGHIAETWVVRSVLKWFRNSHGRDARWLVIIDNADGITWGIRGAIPAGKKGSVIITSRHLDAVSLFPNGGEILMVGELEDVEALDLLLGAIEHTSDSAPRDVRDVAQKIISALGRLPLAIDLARAYIANERRSTSQENAIRSYWTDFERHRNELLSENTFLELGTYDKTVRNVWDTTLHAIDQKSPDSVAPLLIILFQSRKYTTGGLSACSSQTFS